MYEVIYGLVERQAHRRKKAYYLLVKIPYIDHAANLLVYFVFWGARAEDRTRGCLTAARRATCMLRRHPKYATSPPYMLRRRPFFYYF